MTPRVERAVCIAAIVASLMVVTWIAVDRVRAHRAVEDARDREIFECELRGGVAVKRWHPSDYIGRPVCVTVLQRPVT